MNCPSCRQPMREPSPACPHCGFKLDDLMPRFGAIPRYNAFATDTTFEEISAWELKRMKRHLEYFERKFPQVRISIFVTKLLPGIPIGEYTFYVFNRCHFSAMRAKQEKNFGILLVIDFATSSACMITGYGLEGIVLPEEMERILGKCSPLLERRKFISLSQTLVKEFSSLLKNKIKDGQEVVEA